MLMAQTQLSLSQSNERILYSKDFNPAISRGKSPVTNITGAMSENGKLTANKSRLWTVAGAHAAIWAGSFVALNKAWYKEYPRESFHFFDDRREWNQMDKIGHIWTAYTLSRHSAAAWKWSGVNERHSAWLGAGSAFAFQSIVEILDGFSSQWGFSIGDMEANLMGSGGFLVQELLFKKQILQIKMSYNAYDYPPDLYSRRNQLFGKTLPEQILKDYNSQRYWFTTNIASVFPESRTPAWLNIAFGYSSDGLLGGHENVWNDESGNHVERKDIQRVRRFYLSPDIDLTKIKTKSKLLRSVFFVLNMVKIPAPAIEYNSRGRFRVHAIHF
jgi:hypothetical protein